MLHRVVSLHPSLPGAYGRLAELTGELAHLRAAADVAPADSRDAVLAAYALNRVGAPSEALVYWRRAARLEPANAPLQNELGATARDAGAFAESLAAYRAAIAASPTNAVAYNNLAIDLKDMGDVVGARRAHGAALRASPNFSPMVHLNLLHLDLDMASWRHWPLYAWRAARRPPAGAEAEWPWSRLEARAYLSGSAALLNAAAAAEAAAVEAHAAAKWEGCGRCRKRPPPLAPPGARAPLRIALLSDLDQDPSARLLARALPLLGAATRRGGRPVDAPQIEPLLLSTTAGDGSAALRQIRRGVRTIDLPPAPPAPPPSIAAQQPPPPLCDAQRVLARERPHIILEAMSYLPQNQLVLLARKCAAAPVHASWLRNFHGSMEASFIQYAVADRIVLPPLEARGWAEAPLLMPHAHLVSSGLPTPPPPPPPPRAPPPPPPHKSGRPPTGRRSRRRGSRAASIGSTSSTLPSSTCGAARSSALAACRSGSRRAPARSRMAPSRTPTARCAPRPSRAVWRRAASSSPHARRPPATTSVGCPRAMWRSMRCAGARTRPPSTPSARRSASSPRAAATSPRAPPPRSSMRSARPRRRPPACARTPTPSPPSSAASTARRRPRCGPRIAAGARDGRRWGSRRRSSFRSHAQVT